MPKPNPKNLSVDEARASPRVKPSMVALAETAAAVAGQLNDTMKAAAAEAEPLPRAALVAEARRLLALIVQAAKENPGLKIGKRNVIERDLKRIERGELVLPSRV